MNITIRGREYQVNAQPCSEENTVYYITGKRGHKWYTMRNQNYTYMLFLMPEKGISKTMNGVWLTDQNGKLEVVSE